MRVAAAAFLVLTLVPQWGLGQTGVGIPQESSRPRMPTPATSEEFLTNRPSNTPTSLNGEEYRIGRDDLIDVTVFEVPELSAASRVSAAGIISLPLIGPLEVAGRTTQEVEARVEAALKEKYVNDPHVTVMIREYASQPVSVLGAVKLPGIYQIKGQKSLLDMLAMAQGLDVNVAGSTIQVIRRAGPARNGAATDGEPTGGAISINTEELFQNGQAELNIPIRAGDVINVLQAGSIFVVGEVMRPNEYVLRNGKSITVTQAVALGGGFSREAKRANCMIIRYSKDRSKQEIPINVSRVLQGLDLDIELNPNDILFVPASKVKSGLTRTLDSVVSIVVGRAIYAR